MPEPILVDDVSVCQAAVAELLKEPEVAIDLEGVALGRHPGKISILQAVGKHNPDTVYLFDISVLKNDAFEAGRLRDLFASTAVQKIFWDVRADCDALYHNHNVKVENAYDLQILYHLSFIPSSPNVPGLKTAFAEFGKTELTEATMNELKAIKEKGLHLFLPEHGGTYAVFEERPLKPVLVQYCAADVKYLLDMKVFWGTADLDSIVLRTTPDRIMKFISGAGRGGDEGQRVDFLVPHGLKAKLPAGVVEGTVTIPNGKKGRVIGRGGASIKSIQTESGANVSIDDDVARVRGTPEAVEAAKRLIRRACQ